MHTNTINEHNFTHGAIINKPWSGMDDYALQRAAPSVYAAQPFHKMSDRYAFVPTINVVNALRAEGFHVVRASEQRVRLPEKRGFAKHMLRFRQEGIRPAVGDVFPEIVLTNSHDGSSAYIIEAGFFRLACSNGLVVSASVFDGIRVRHSRNVIADALEGTFSIVKEAPALVERVDNMRAIQLTNGEQAAFARAALALRYDGEQTGGRGVYGGSPVSEDQILRPRRIEDNAADLWTTFNRVQENMVKGGLRGRAANGRRSTTREIKGIDQTRTLNKALWTLAEEMAKLKG